MTKDSQVTPAKHRRQRERGQSTVELALTMPILLFLLVGLIEFGHGMNSYLTVLSAARDAARMGAQGGVTSETTLINLIHQETGRLPSDIPWASENCGAGAGICIDGITNNVLVGGVRAVKVKVCYNHPVLIGVPGIFKGPILMCSQTTMRIATL